MTGRPREGDPLHVPEPRQGLQRLDESRNEALGHHRVEAIFPPEVDDLESTRPSVEARLDPSDKAIAEEEWQDVVAPASFRGRHVDLPDVVEAVQRTQEVTVPHEWIERGEERDAWRPGVGHWRAATSGCLEKSDFLGQHEAISADPLDGDRDERSGFDQLSEQLAPGRGIRTMILADRLGGADPQFGTPRAPEETMRPIA